MDNEDEVPTLSGSSLSALQEFLSERDQHVRKFEALKSQAEDENQQGKWTMDSFAENWQDSQFWYSEETAFVLAEELLGPRESWKGRRIAVVSAPSAFVEVKNLLKESGLPKEECPEIFLLEFDTRFEVFGKEFVYYDFNSPIQLPVELKGTMDHIICDPPFLSEDCQTKAALTVRWLSNPLLKVTDASTEGPAKGRLIVCTGERMEAVIHKVYKAQGIATTTFEPVHNKQQLSNEFLCYANFECERWKWKPKESQTD